MTSQGFGAGAESLPLNDGVAAATDATANAAALVVGGDEVSAAAGEAALSVADLTWYPSHMVMQGIEAMHVATGLPYWATIVCITVGMRSLLLPLALGTMRNSARMAVSDD